MTLTISGDIVGFVVGLLGLAIAIWQVISARKARQMHREKCETRCKDLVQTVRQLGQAVTIACDIKDENLDDIMLGKLELSQAIRPLRQLSDQIHSIDGAKNQLVRFCERLDDEHRQEFGEPVFKDIRKELVGVPAPVIRLDNLAQGADPLVDQEKRPPNQALKAS